MEATVLLHNNYQDRLALVYLHIAKRILPPRTILDEFVNSEKACSYLSSFPQMVTSSNPGANPCMIFRDLHIILLLHAFEDG